MPRCWKPDEEHEWAAPHEIVGGWRRAPGISAMSNGLRETSVCLKCGCLREIFADAPRYIESSNVRYMEQFYHVPLTAHAEGEGRRAGSIWHRDGVCRAFAERNAPMYFDDLTHGRYIPVARDAALVEFDRLAKGGAQ